MEALYLDTHVVYAMAKGSPLLTKDDKILSHFGGAIW